MRLKIAAASAAVLMMFSVICTASAAAGEKGDPLISREYLESKFQDNFMGRVRSEISSGFSSVESRILDIGAESGSTGQFAKLKLAAGDKAVTALGGSFILVNGTANYNVPYGSIINLTTGRELSGSGRLEAGSRYMAAENSILMIRSITDSEITADGGGVKTGGDKNAPAFKDVASSNWAFEAVETMASLKLVNGTGYNSFSPGNNMTRGDFVTVLGRLYGIDPAEYRSSVFSDVPASAYYSPYVNWANANGLVGGYGSGVFGPRDSITRAQMAVLMVRYARYVRISLPQTVGTKFSDNSSIPQWAEADVYTARAAGYIQGKGNNTFDPSGTSLRTEVCALIYRMLTN